MRDRTREIATSAVAAAARLAGAFPLFLPAVAYASDGRLGWSMSGGDGGNGILADDPTGAFTPDSVMSVVTVLIRTGLGIAIAVFVLKVVLTAADRLLIGGTVAPGPAGPPQEQSMLSQIPLIGAYPPPEPTGGGYTWGAIFKRFFIQVSLCVGALLITELALGILKAAFSAAGVGGAAAAGSGATTGGEAAAGGVDLGPTVTA